MIRGILCSFLIVSRFSIFLTLVSYVFFGHIFTSRQVFVVTSCFNFLYDSMLYFWTVAVTSIAECFVSMRRIEDFLLMSETKTVKKEHVNFAFTPDDQMMYNENKSHKTSHVRENSHDTCVIFKNVTAKWNNENQSNIKDVNLQIDKNQLIAINGPVAAGKSTIFHVILRELEIDSGEVITNGIVSYASQEPWIFDSTVRQNILFTEQFDINRYANVIRACGLERDIQSILPAGDLTRVGESGICLSGGQKARINLARAVYRKADIYLLDDPLSAIDAAVGKHIFDNCIKDFLREKICILITHQEQFINDANRMIFVRNGRIEYDKEQTIIENARNNSLELTKTFEPISQTNMNEVIYL